MTGVVVNPQGTTPAAGTLVVNWTPAPTLGVDGYKVQWRTRSQNWDPSSRQVEETTTSTTTIDGITYSTTTIGNNTPNTDMPLEGAFYQVRVIAKNSDGDGEPSVAASGTPLAGEVQNPMVTPGIETLEVKWEAAIGATGYKVQWRSVTDNESFDGLTVATDDPDDRTSPIVTGPNHTIDKLSAEKEYAVQVIATNAAGVDATTPAVVSGQFRPEPPTAGTPTVTPGPEELTVEWDEVDGATGYKVQWKSGDEKYDDLTDTDDAADTRTATPTSSTPSPVTGTSYTITGLMADTEYTVRVIATNTTGDSDPSSDVPGKKPIPGQVLMVMLDPGAGSLMVEWDERTGADRYKVQWKSETDRYEPSRQLMTDDGSETSLEIPGLTAGTTYTVQVFAENTSGEGEPSVGAMETPLPGKVGTPTMTPGDRELTVNWNPVPGDGIGYKVQWKSEDQEYDDLTDDDADIRTATPTSSTPSPVTGTSYTITSLMAENTYTVRVIATSETEDLGGDGDFSDDATGNGRPKPGPIGTVTVEQGVRSLNVSWTRVAGADEYIVQWKLSADLHYDRTRLATEPQTEETTVRHRIPELSEDATYMVEVYAKNEGGEGEHGSSSNSPSVATNDQVVGVEVTPETEQLEVSWDAVPDADEYTVQWRLLSESGFDDLTDTDDAADTRTKRNVLQTNYTIPTLTAFEYTVQVIATVDEMRGDASVPETETPKPGQVMGVMVESVVGELEVEWEEILGTDVTYTVQWREDSQDYSTRSRMKKDLSVTSTTLDTDNLRGPGGLKPAGQKYWVQVYAENASGKGPVSGEVSDTPLPGKVTPTVTRGPQHEVYPVNWTVSGLK